MQAADAVLMGAVGGPQWDTGAVRPEMGIFALRAPTRGVRERPPGAPLVERLVRPLQPELAEGIDMVIVRELTGGLYFGERGTTSTARSTRCSYTRREIERIARRGFELARPRRGSCARRQAERADVVQALARRRATMAADYPDVELAHQLVDSMAMKLVEQPAAYDVIVTENMFGDILSDLAASVARRHRPRAVVVARRRPARACTRRSTAPRRTSPARGKANPTATILTASMMLRDLGETAAADAIEARVVRLLDEGPVTPDLGGSATTDEFGAAVARPSRHRIHYEVIRDERHEPGPRHATTRRPPDERRRMTGAEAVIRSLEAEGVDICWGIPGGAILPLYDAWARVEHTVRHILVRHEQGAGHMAQGYARATGKVGVCMGTSGPGATNLVTPVADAFLDSTPLVVDHGPGADAPDRHRRLPGGRHDRHLHADHEALLPRHRRGRHPARDEGGVPHRPHRPPRPGAGRHPEGRRQRDARLP